MPDREAILSPSRSPIDLIGGDRSGYRRSMLAHGAAGSPPPVPARVEQARRPPPAVQRTPVASVASVQRMPAVQRSPVNTEAEFGLAVGRGEWKEAVDFLVGRSPQDIERLAGTVDLPKCEGLLGAVPGVQNTVRGLLLERAFALAKGSDWVKAARFVSTLDDAGIDKNIGKLTDPENKQLGKGARNGPGGGDQRLIGRIIAKLRKTEGQLFGTLVAVGSVDRQGKKTGMTTPDEAYAYLMNITFTPDPDVVDATSIAFVQTMSMLTTGTKDSQDPRRGISGRLNSEGQAVDRGPRSKSGWYGQNNDGNFTKSSTFGVTPGTSSAGSATPALLTDRPEAKIANTTWSYETSVIAKAGNDVGLVYAVVRWRFVVDGKLQITDIKKPTYHQTPTASFGTAVGAWNKQARTDPQSRDGQDQLPVQRSIETGSPPARTLTVAPVQELIRRQEGDRALDRAGRGRMALALQRSVGNHATGLALAPGRPAPRPSELRQPPLLLQRCGGEVHAGCACAEEVATRPTSIAEVQRDVAVQRDDKGPFTAAREAFAAMERKAQLATIQGLPMDQLLTKLAAMPPEVKKDEVSAQSSGGARLVAAMRAVAAKGTTPWDVFAGAQNALLGGLPPDQIGEVIRYLGGPKDAGYYKSDQIKVQGFGGKFDGSVDPVAGVVTLYFRVAFNADAVRWGTAAPGTPDGEAQAQAGRAKFEADFKRVVESTWSFKGKVKPLCPIGAVSAFATKVVVTVVPLGGGEHTHFQLFSNSAEGRSNAGGGEGNLKVGDTETSKPVTTGVSDPTGKKQEQVTTSQAPAAHEFGHAIGLHHPHCKGADDNCYGVTAQERQDIMGAGSLLQVIKRGKQAPHDDFAPFEAIAKTWGDEHMLGAMAKCNVWSAQ